MKIGGRDLERVSARRIKRSHMHIREVRTDGRESEGQAENQEELVEQIRKKKKERLICVKREIYFGYPLEHNFDKRLIYMYSTK